jgi:hypothetical protein
MEHNDLHIVEAHFFSLPISDQAQKIPDVVLRAQSQLGPVICGNRKVRGNSFKPLTKPKRPSWPTCPKSTSAATMRSLSKKFKKERETL